MGSFKASLVNEIQKLYKKKKALVAVILSLLVIILGQAGILGVRKGFGVRGTSSSEFPILVLYIVVNSILPLFTALVTIDSFSGEFSHNTMKIALTRPISRVKFFAAKLTAIMVFVLSNLMLIMILSILAGFIFNANSFNFGALIRILISYIVTLIPMLILALVIILIANILRSGVAVFFLSILIFIGFKALEVFFSKYSGIFFTAYFDWYNLFLMDTIPWGKILRDFMMMLSYGIILFTGSFYLFDKKDF